ncbi:MAG TPA: hypothetical protein VF316_17290 [Polyangiaceae bacterium]
MTDAMQTLNALCPTCGAPLDLRADSTIVLCMYCRQTTRIVPPDPSRPGDAPTLVTHDVGKEVTDQVIALVLAGKRPEAIELYARAANVPPADADKAVTQVSQWATIGLVKNGPMSARGIVRALLLIPAFGAGAAYGLALGHWVLGLVLALLCCFFLVSFVRQIPATLIRFRRAQGHATVLRTAIVQANFVYGCTLIVVRTNVRPLDGSPPFEDDEPLLLRTADLEKVVPGNIIRVRFDRERGLVFPGVPVEVVGHA